MIPNPPAEWFRAGAHCLLMLGCVIGAASGFAEAPTGGGDADRQPSSLPFGRDDSDGPLCGLTSLRGALAAVDLGTPTMREMIRPQFIGGYEGSSTKNLCEAAEHFGASATAVTQLNVDQLAKIQSPVILHWRGTIQRKTFNHWVLYLGITQGGFRIIDHPAPMSELSAAEVAAYWDGTGILIQNPQVEGHIDRADLVMAMVTTSHLPALLIVFSFLYAAGLLIKRYQVDRPQISGLAAVVPVLAATAALVVWRHAASADGLLIDPGSYQRVVAIHQEPKFEMLATAQELSVAMSQNEEVLLIDSRMPADFAYGHLDGAINLPIYATRPERNQILSAWSEQKQNLRLMIYCQSDRCEYSDIVAKQLSEDGWANPTIYRGGWMDWASHTAQETK